MKRRVSMHCEPKRALCPHGVEYGKGGFYKINGGKPMPWMGGIGRCSCCLSNFPVISHSGGFYNDKTNQWNSFQSEYKPTNRCEDCR